MDSLTFLFFVLAGVLLTWIAIVQILFYRYLRVNHAETWKRLGQPTLFWNMSPLVQSRVTRFWKSEYTQLGDPRIDAFGRRLRHLTTAFVMAFISFIGLGVWGWIFDDEARMARQPAAPSSTSTHDPVGLVVLAVLTLLGIPGWVLYGRFCDRLRLEHPEVWDALGSPTITGFSIKTQLSTSRFLWSLRYRKLDDSRLSRLGDAQNLLGLVIVVILIVWFLAR